MRILAISDLRVQSIRLLEQVAGRWNPDLIVYGGDDVVRFGPGPHSWSPLATRARHGLAGVIGNDCTRDHAAALAQPGCHDLDRGPLLLDGLAVIGLGGAPADEGGGIGYTLYTREQAREQLLRHLAMVGKRPVLLVSHAPPHGVLDLAIRFGVDHIGSSVVREVLTRREVRGVVCGHVHSKGGREERIGNALVVNVASHDAHGSSMVYAVLDWDGRRFDAQLRAIRENDEIRCVPGVGWLTASKLEQAGIRTMSDLLAGDGRELAAVVGSSSTARRMRAGARAQTTGVPVLLSPGEPFPTDSVIVDVETSFDRQDDPWLVAFRPFGGLRVRQIQELDLAQHPEHLTRVDKALSAFGDTRFVRWGTFDRAALARAYGVVGLASPAWLAEDAWFDACSWVKRVVALPAASSGLKYVGEHLGYRFAYPKLDGLLVGQWYTMYRTKGTAFDVQKVRAYNRDDVAGVEHVVRAVQAMARRSDLMIEPAVPDPRRGTVVAPALSVAERAVAGFRASMDARVASGELTPAKRDRAVAKYEVHMRGLHSE
ncbi:MAG: ribonuclease H-like domain-containing protein [Pseudomonadota bacterium]|nr:ribonuclease H-like domain-containing protein [Pseudomonadota bacterium]